MMSKIKILIHRVYRSLVHPLPIKNKPKFLIIGAQKAGTTSLHSMLIKHPKLNGGLKKEIHFFDRPANFNKGLNWYYKNFKSLSFSQQVYFDATPDYVAYPDVLEKIKNYDSKIPMIFILREPISRAFSAWNFYKRFPRYSELPEFHSVINQELAVINDNNQENWITNLRILRRGLYFEQIQNLKELFGLKNVLLLKAEDLKKDPETVLNNILEFIEITEYDWNIKPAKRNTGKYITRIDLKDERILKSFYAEDLKLLKEHYQIEFNG